MTVPPRRAVSDAWRSFRAETDLDEYDSRWDRLAAQGVAVHGEAEFVRSFEPRSVLDAGCGTGRVAIELARHGIEVAGVDLDPDLLARARRRAPELTWIEADLATLDLDRRFDVVVMAGNVVPFAVESDRPAVVTSCARHLEPGGRLVLGVHLAAGWPRAEDYDAWAAAAGLSRRARYAGWSREAWPDPARGVRSDPASYVVAVYGRDVSPTPR